MRSEQLAVSILLRQAFAVGLENDVSRQRPIDVADDSIVEAARAVYPALNVVPLCTYIDQLDR